VDCISKCAFSVLLVSSVYGVLYLQIFVSTIVFHLNFVVFLELWRQWPSDSYGRRFLPLHSWPHVLVVGVVNKETELPVFDCWSIIFDWPDCQAVVGTNLLQIFLSKKQKICAADRISATKWSQLRCLWGQCEWKKEWPPSQICVTTYTFNQQPAEIPLKSNTVTDDVWNFKATNVALNLMLLEPLLRLPPQFAIHQIFQTSNTRHHAHANTRTQKTNFISGFRQNKNVWSKKSDQCQVKPKATKLRSRLQIMHKASWCFKK